MEEHLKSNHSCKFCFKVFPCGRSLGGHMRSHLIPTQKLHQNPILVDDKLCKECGRSFQSWKALFGHMKSHSVIVSVEEDPSDNEAAALCRKKRSERAKRFTNSADLDQQEQEEVALSLILLSMDCVSSVVESYNTTSESSEAKKPPVVSCNDASSGAKKLDSEFRAPRKRMKSSEDFECEVNSPKTLIKKNGSSGNPFGSDHKKRRNSSKKKCIDSDSSEVINGYKFNCIICKKGFPSYQALGGHRASHKKFKGCCAPISENASQTDDQAPDCQEKIDDCKKSKEHECPVCYRVFPSGQALGGHKRSHLINDQTKNTDPSVSTQRRIPEIHGFLDLNLPAPAEEDGNEFNTWWIGTSRDNHQEPLLGLLSG